MTIILVFLIGMLQTTEIENGWVLFGKVNFESEYFKSENTYYLVPRFDKNIKSKEGLLVELKGYYLPFDMPGNALIISRNPYASCFFCGGAGPESVAEVALTSKLPRLKPDQVITVRGKLKLNATDVNHMCFQLIEAEILN